MELPVPQKPEVAQGDAADDPGNTLPRKAQRIMWEPGIHYKVREEVNMNPDIVVFPEIETMDSFRHRWILRRRKRPMVPAPTHTPMPDKEKSKAGKCKLLSLYMRPWVLDRRFESRHVPHITDLDVVFDQEACAARVSGIGSLVPREQNIIHYFRNSFLCMVREDKGRGHKHSTPNNINMIRCGINVFPRLVL